MDKDRDRANKKRNLTKFEIWATLYSLILRGGDGRGAGGAQGMFSGENMDRDRQDWTEPGPATSEIIKSKWGKEGKKLLAGRMSELKSNRVGNVCQGWWWTGVGMGD